MIPDTYKLKGIMVEICPSLIPELCQCMEENKYGCQGLTTCFLAYWLNFNQFFANLWNGFNGFEAFDRNVSAYGVKDFVDEKIALTYKELIAGEYLKKVNHLDPEGEPENNWYEFEADRLNNVNVFNEGGHHWGLYIKRGAFSTGERRDNEADKREPGRDGSRNYIWRLAADGILIQEYDDSGLDKESVKADITKFNEAADSRACNETVHIWKLKDIMPNGWAPCPYSNPAFIMNGPALIGQ